VESSSICRLLLHISDVNEGLHISWPIVNVCIYKNYTYTKGGLTNQNLYSKSCDGISFSKIQSRRFTYIQFWSNIYQFTLFLLSVSFLNKPFSDLFSKLMGHTQCLATFFWGGFFLVVPNLGEDFENAMGGIKEFEGEFQSLREYPTGYTILIFLYLSKCRQLRNI